jgi:hypothetical protein
LPERTTHHSRSALHVFLRNLEFREVEAPLVASHHVKALKIASDAAEMPDRRSENFTVADGCTLATHRRQFADLREAGLDKEPNERSNLRAAIFGLVDQRLCSFRFDAGADWDREIALARHAATLIVSVEKHCFSTVFPGVHGGRSSPGENCRWTNRRFVSTRHGSNIPESGFLIPGRSSNEIRLILLLLLFGSSSNHIEV